MGLFDKAESLFDNDPIEEDQTALFETERGGGGFAFVDTNDAGGYRVEDARTGEVEDLDPIQSVGFMSNATPTGLAATEKNKKAATRAANLNRQSPLDVHTSRSPVAQGRDEAVRAEKVTTNPFEYGLAPDEMDFKGLDTPQGARDRAERFEKGDKQFPELFD